MVHVDELATDSSGRLRTHGHTRQVSINSSRSPWRFCHVLSWRQPSDFDALAHLPPLKNH